MLVTEMKLEFKLKHTKKEAQIAKVVNDNINKTQNHLRSDTPWTPNLKITGHVHNSIRVRVSKFKTRQTKNRKNQRTSKSINSIFYR